MKKNRSFEARLLRLSLISSVPPWLCLLWLMIYAGVSIWLLCLSTLVGVVLVIYTSYYIHQKLVYQFRSLNNILDALTRGDYSLRVRSGQGSGALDELVLVVNGLAQRLSQQRRESVESQLLVKTIIDHIDVAIVALDGLNQISFYNPAAKKLLLLDNPALHQKFINQLSQVESAFHDSHDVVELSLGYQQGRFNVHVEEFRESGTQHKLLFITDVRTLLRGEERKAWQSLVRVISHEINNSLSPIASISQTLNRLISRQESIPNGKDLVEGLTIITERANGLSQFVNSYKKLAKLPEPKKQMVSITKLVDRIRFLFSTHNVIVKAKNDVFLFIDPTQFEQVLINLLKNAVEAMLQTNRIGEILVNWGIEEQFFRLEILDQGCGFINQDNLFVPFYSTKKHGSGIGLVLCRQIIEAHNGYLSIANRTDSLGCCASIELPFEQAKVA